MANTSDDVLRVILEVQGQQELARLNAQLDQEAEALKKLDAQLAATANPSARLVADQAAAEAQARKTAAELLKVKDALRQTGAGSAAAARGVLEFSRAAEDFSTGGFLGVLNNIPGMAQSAGQALQMTGAQVAAVTAGVSLAATAAYSLWKNWDKLADAVGLGATRTEAERMEDLGNKTHRTAEETAALNKYKREQAEIDAVINSQSKADKTREQLVKEAVGEAGGKSVLDALFKARNPDGTGEHRLSGEDQVALQDLRDRAAAARAGGRVDRQAEDRVKELLDKARADEQKESGRLIADAAHDTDAQREVIRELGRDPKQRQFVRQLAEALPENIEKHHFDDEFNKGQRSLDEALEHDRQEKEAAAKKAEHERDRRLAEIRPGFQDLDHQNKAEEAERDRSAREKARAHEQAVAHAVTAFRPALDDPLMFDMTDPGKKGRDFTPGVASRLRDTGRVDPSVVEEAARKIVEDVKTELARKLLEKSAEGHAAPEAAVHEDLRSDFLRKGERGRREQLGAEDAAAAREIAGMLMARNGLNERQAMTIALKSIKDAMGNFALLGDALDANMMAFARQAQALGGKARQLEQRQRTMRPRANPF